MNSFELERIKKSQAVIANINAEADKRGLSYGQLQAERYEQQLKLERLEKQIAEEQKNPPVRKSVKGRPQKLMPESFPEIAEIMLSGNMSRKQASILLHVSPQTVQKRLDEYVSNSKSCRK